MSHNPLMGQHGVSPPSVEQAKIIAGVVAQADGYCYVCARELADELAREWPGLPWRELVAQAGGWGPLDD